MRIKSLTKILAGTFVIGAALGAARESYSDVVMDGLGASMDILAEDCKTVKGKRAAHAFAYILREMGDDMDAEKLADKMGTKVIIVNQQPQEQRRKNWQLPPENVVLKSNGMYSPAEGYEWLNTNKEDHRVRKKATAQRQEEYLIINRENRENNLVKDVDLIDYLFSEAEKNKIPKTSYWVGIKGSNGGYKGLGYFNLKNDGENINIYRAKDGKSYVLLAQKEINPKKERFPRPLIE